MSQKTLTGFFFQTAVRVFVNFIWASDKKSKSTSCTDEILPYILLVRIKFRVIFIVSSRVITGSYLQVKWAMPERGKMKEGTGEIIFLGSAD